MDSESFVHDAWDVATIVSIVVGLLLVQVF